MTAEPAALSVEYFRSILDTEAKNLSQLCDRWSQAIENEAIEDEDYVGSIRTTIGQAKLLMSQRFKQFSSLIDDCEFKTGKLPTRLNDLSGFWEMISFQVVDVMRKFEKLEAMKVNGN